VGCTPNSDHYKTPVVCPAQKCNACVDKSRSQSERTTMVLLEAEG